MKIFKICLFGVSLISCFSTSAGPCSRGPGTYHCPSILEEDMAVCEETANMEEMTCSIPYYNLSVTFPNPEDNEDREGRIQDKIVHLCVSDMYNCHQERCYFVGFYCDRS